MAALAEWHPGHDESRAALAGVDVIIAHVIVETYSVLTRLPAPHRIAPRDAAAVVGVLPWDVVRLPPSEHTALVAGAGRLAISGGAVYDALIAFTAKNHGLTVLTRDRRSRRTYDLIGAGVRVLGDG